ncbi:MAG TPA: PD-(D/E)XK nuclease family protein, partial [Opitutaceae bacterium]|nr:PD-(D/E)XK nuclease family protein [Opitutaceae bacterium]
MEFSLDNRTAALGVGEFAAFAFGPRGDAGGPSGLWRAQLGTHWHQELHARAAEENPGATAEVPIAGRLVHRGWTLTLSGRIDQLLPREGATVLREIKTVMRPLPAPEAELRAEHPDYFVQLAAYLALLRANGDSRLPAAELLFVEAASGLVQPVALAPADEALFRAQLERVVEFLEHRRRARDRLRSLHFRPAFAELRPGQAEAAGQLRTAVAAPSAAVFFEAPTGFGKTGVLLEAALTELRDGRFERVLYLTSKATGQLQVGRTLAAMTATEAGDPAAAGVGAWLVRPKSEHCINPVFHCVRDACGCLDDPVARWAQSGLGRFYLLPGQPRDLEALRAAGR